MSEMRSEAKIVYTDNPYVYARMIARNSKMRWGGKCRDYYPNALKLAREELAKEAKAKSIAATLDKEA